MPEEPRSASETIRRRINEPPAPPGNHAGRGARGGDSRADFGNNVPNRKQRGEPMNWRVLGSEAVGTFALVFTGCGAIVVNDLFNVGFGALGVNIVFGLIVMAVVYSLGNVSGAHINPAVSVAFCAAGRLPRNLLAPYIAAQCVGAIAAAFLLRLLFPDHASYGMTMTGLDLPRTFLFEVLLSFFLMFVIFNVLSGNHGKQIMAGLVIGSAVTLLSMFGGGATGASMNPARSLGPALAAGNLDLIWLYLTAPPVGMLLAWPASRWLQGENFLQQPD